MSYQWDTLRLGIEVRFIENQRIQVNTTFCEVQMIDTQSEALVPISEAPSLVPSRPHVATIWRWVKRGCRGAKLETVLIGGRRFTSIEAIQRFFEATTEAAAGTSGGNPGTSSKSRRRSVQNAESELDSAGI